MRVNVNNTHQFNQDFTKMSGHARLQVRIRMAVAELHQPRHLEPAPDPSHFGGTTNGLQANGSSIPNTGGISLADIMLGYVYSYSYAQQGASLSR